MAGQDKDLKGVTALRDVPEGPDYLMAAREGGFKGGLLGGVIGAIIAVTICFICHYMLGR